jgi:hypothetical protein
MATQIGSGSTTLATYIPDLADTANIQTALKQLYYGTVGGTLNQTTGIYGALYTLYTGNPTLAGNVTITGTLTVNGTTTTVNSTTLTIDDKNIVLGNDNTLDTQADGGGITLNGNTAKTFNWVDATDSWTSSENIDLAANKTLKIGTSNVISGTAAALVLGANASTSITLGHASGITTILGTTQLTSGSTKIGNTTLTQGGTVGITLPTLAGTLVGTGDTGSVTSTMIADGTILTGDLASSSSTSTGVTYAKMQYASAQYRVLGRISASAGVVEELTPDNLITTLNQATTALQVGKGGTGATTAPAAMANLMGYTPTATAAGTTTLTNASSYYQQFTGSTTQTVVLPVTSTLITGWTFHIVNNSTGNLTVNSSGGNLVITVIPGTTAMVTCINIGVTDATGWEFGLTDFSSSTGTGAVVMGTSPVITPAAPAGTTSGTVTTSASTAGYIGMPQNSKSASYTLQATDAGKHIYVTTTGQTITIPANSSVAFEIGTAITIINAASVSTSIAITTDTMLLANAGTTGTRTLAAHGVATLIKITATSWIASGNGLT